MELKVDRYIIEEIMKLECDNSVGHFNSFNLLNSKSFVELINGSDNNLFYRCSIDDIINSDISAEELILIRNGGWELSKNKEFIVKYI